MRQAIMADIDPAKVALEGAKGAVAVALGKKRPEAELQPLVEAPCLIHFKFGIAHLDPERH